MYLLYLRFIGTFSLTWVLNKWNSTKISWEEQFIMSYGGLRGAVGFSLATVLPEDAWYRELFLTTALGL